MKDALSAGSPCSAPVEQPSALASDYRGYSANQKLNEQQRTMDGSCRNSIQRHMRLRALSGTPTTL